MTTRILVSEDKGADRAEPPHLPIRAGPERLAARDPDPLNIECSTSEGSPTIEHSRAKWILLRAKKIQKKQRIRAFSIESESAASIDKGEVFA